MNGVGAKVGLAILSALDADSLTRAVQDGDVQSLTRVPGIGKRTAERLVVEMRDRLGDGTSYATALSGHGGDRVATDPVSEAVSALIALGLKPPEASRRVAAIENDGLPPEEIVRIALKAMAG